MLVSFVPSTPDLFGTPESADLRQRLLDVFEHWISARAQNRSAGKAHRPLREDSAQVYRDMWGRFAGWCVDHTTSPERIDTTDLQTFLDSLGGVQEATPRYVKRMLYLIGRVDRAQAREDGRAVNPAIQALKDTPRYRFSGTAADEPQPEFLTAREARLLVDYVTARQEAPSAETAWPWQEVRNRTAVALQLGGGITPGEARTLSLERIIIDGGRIKGEPWALSLPANGNFPARQTPLAGWAGKQLAYWLQIRAQQGLAGSMVFPSTRSGKEWSKAPSTLSFQAVLRGAGIDHPTGGTFKLRHTFALRQLTRHPPDQVARWLGVQDPAVIERYQRVLFNPVDIV